MHRRLDVNNAIRGMGVQPVKAASADSEHSIQRVLQLARRNDPDSVRDLAWRAVHKDCEMGVNVQDKLGVDLTQDPVNWLPSGHGAGGREDGRKWDGYSLGSDNGRVVGDRSRSILWRRCGAARQGETNAGPDACERDDNDRD